MTRVLLPILVVIAVAGCGGDGNGSDEPRVTDAATAIGLSGGTNVTVRGYFAHEPDAIVPRMCTNLTEAYPPSCEMPSLPVSNLSEQDEADLPLTRDPETGARWSQREIELSGRIEDGALVVQ
jgi:hypothetical protein